MPGDDREGNAGADIPPAVTDDGNHVSDPVSDPQSDPQNDDESDMP